MSKSIAEGQAIMDQLSISHRATLEKSDRMRSRSMPARKHIVWYDLKVPVRNHSARPLYVISQIRRIEYDPNERLLRVRFGETDTPPELAHRIAFPPGFIELPPGKEAELQFPLSSPISFLERTPDGEFRINQVSLETDVDQVDCTVAFGASRPPRAVNLASDEEQGNFEPWRQWGSNIDVRLPINSSKRQLKTNT